MLLNSVPGEMTENGISTIQGKEYSGISNWLNYSHKQLEWLQFFCETDTKIPYPSQCPLYLHAYKRQTNGKSAGFISFLFSQAHLTGSYFALIQNKNQAPLTEICLMPILFFARHSGA